MKVLVTGGCGLIGFHIAKHNRNIGNEVWVMDNFERSQLLGHGDVQLARKHFNKDILHEMGIHVIEKDVSHNESFSRLTNFDVVFHMAAQCGVPTSIEDPRRDFEVNAVGTLNVLEYARRTGATVIYASTNKVYPLHDAFVKTKGRWTFGNLAWQVEGFPVVDGLKGARTPYGTSKYAGDLLCQEYAHTYGIRTGVFRMSCIYGPNQFGFEEQGWATYFIIAASRGWPITIYGDGDQVRDMLHATDVVDAYMKFVNSGIKHGVWNLGGGWDNAVSLHDHIAWIKKHTGKDLAVTYKDWRPLDQKCYVSNIDKIKKELNWAPTIDPPTGLSDVAEWVGENSWVF